MKKVLILLFSLIQISVYSQVYQLPNGDFEAWENVGSENVEPLHWNSFMTAEGSMVGLGAAQRINVSTDVRPGSPGTKSIRIYATSIIGIIANGLVTTGRVNMGSTSAGDATKNFNKTKRAEPGFNQPFDGKPDSLRFWAKFVCPSTTQEARFRATIHDDYDYKDPADGDANAPLHVVGVGEKEFSRGNQGWVQYTVPFDYIGPATTPRYMLISITTNKVAGSGSSNDNLYIDDIEFIYNTRLSNLQVAGVTVSNFNPDVTDYYMYIPCNQSLPLITAAATASPQATYVITQANYENRFAKIVVTNGNEAKEYRVYFPPTPPPTVVINGNDAFCTGESLAFTASGATSYLWSNGSTTPSINVSSPGTYSVTGTDNNGCSTITEKTVTMDPLPTPSIHASENTICRGGSVNLTAEGGISYLWIENTTGLSATNVAAVTAGNLTSDQTYKVQVTDANGCKATTTTTITTVALPAIVTQPEGTTMCSGGTHTMHVEGSGGAPALAYQWQVSQTGTGGWASVGTNADSYLVQETQFSRYYRVIVSATANGCTAANSNVVQVTIVPDPSLSDPVITDPVICIGGTSSVSSNLQNGLGTPAYQWQYFNGSNWMDVENDMPAGAVYQDATTDNMMISGIGSAGNYRYRLKVNMPGNGCDEAVSNEVTLNVIHNPTLSTPLYTYSTVCEGSSTVISTSLSDVLNNVTYQWQYYDGNEWELVENNVPAGAVYENTATAAMSISNIMSTGIYPYRALANILLPGCQQTQSEAASVTVIETPGLSVPVVSEDIIFTGDTIYINSMVNNENVSGIYQWQFSEDNDLWLPVSVGLPAGAKYANADTDQLTIIPVGVSGNYYYRLTMNLSDVSCREIVSDALQLNVYPTPRLVEPSVDYPVSCQRSTVSVRSKLENGYGSIVYQWEYFDGTNWMPVEDNTPAGAEYTLVAPDTLSVSNITDVGVYEYRLKAILEEVDNRVVLSDVVTCEMVAHPVLSDAIISEPEIQAGASATVHSVLSNGVGITTYKWQYSINDADWNDVEEGTPAGALYLADNAEIMTIKDILQPGDFYYRLKASMAGNGCNLAFSNSAKLTVLDGPSLYNTQISDSVICKSGSSVLSSMLTGTSTNVVLNWQYYNGTVWENVTDGTPHNAIYHNPSSITMTIANIVEAGSYQYRLSAFMENSIYDEVYSAVLTLKVVDQPVLTNPVVLNSAICTGGNTLVSSTVNHTEREVLYQWQYQQGNDWISVSEGIPSGAFYQDANTMNLSVTGISVPGAHRYRLKAKMAGVECGEVISNFVTLTVVPPPSLTVPVVSDTVICAGGNVTVASVLSNGTGTATYQWEYFADDSEWLPVQNGMPAGASYVNTSTQSMAISGITETGKHHYRLKANMSGSGCDEVISNTVSLRVAENPVLSSVAISNPTACSAGSAVVSSGLQNSTDPVVYQWQYSPDNSIWFDVMQGVPAGASYENIQSDAMTIHTITNPGNYYYRLKARLSRPDAVEVITSSVIYTIVANPTAPEIIPSQIQNTVLCEGATISAEFTPGTGGISAQDEYEYTVNGGADWQTYLPGTAITATVVGTEMLQIRTKRTSVTAGCGSSAYNTASWDVVALPVISVSGTNAVCLGNSTTLTATGGNNYLWSNGNTTVANVVSPDETITYSVTGTNLYGCSATAEYTVTVKEIPALILSEDATIYVSEMVTLSVSGASVYIWSTGSVGDAIEVMPVETTTYSVTGTNDLGCSSVASVTVNVLDCNLSSVFTGNGLWNNGDLWSNGIPCEHTDVIITGNCTIPEEYDAVCKNITLSSTIQFTVSETATLQINGEMLMKADMAGNASYINYGNVSYINPVKVEHYVTGGQTEHFAIPVTEVVSGLYQGMELKLFDESQNSWSVITGEDMPLATGAGYAHVASENGIILYTGELHEEEDYLLNLSSSHCYLNTIGNMFTANLTANVQDWNKTNVANGIWMWDPVNENYRVWNGERGSLANYVIPAQQGFIAKATGENATITLSKSDLVHEVLPLPVADNSNVINISIFGNNRSDEAIVKFSDLATHNWDAEYDVEKLHGSVAAPQIATDWNGKQLSINYLPMIQDTILPLYFTSGKSGEYVLKLSGLTSLTPSQYVRFEDKESGIVIPMMSNVFSYSFAHTYSTSDPGDRFRLIFGSPTGINNYGLDGISVYEYDGKVIILNSEMLLIDNVTIYNSVGQQIHSEHALVPQRRTEIGLTAAPGIYLINLKSEGKEATYKVAIR